jgi:hypothetical protein
MQVDLILKWMVEMRSGFLCRSKIAYCRKATASAAMS